MNFSFEDFAYKKKPSVLTIEDSDSDESIKCLDDEKKVELEDSPELFSGYSNEVEEDEDVNESSEDGRSLFWLCIY